MDIRIYPGKLKGTVKAPPSKSVAHRALICASLAEGRSVIRGISGSRDMDATIGCMRALGADIRREEGDIAVVEGIGPGSGIFHPEEEKMAQKTATLDCIESGSTLRFLLPVAAALGAEAAFRGRGKLPERPMTPLADEMKKKGVEFLPEGRDRLPFSIRGRLHPGVFEIPGNVSSQYISGLLFALPLLKGSSEIRVKGRLESAGYVALTLQMIRDFGVEIEENEAGFLIAGDQRYLARDVEVESDYSQAAFWLTAAACGSDLSVTGLREDSSQGDREAVDILRRFGAVVERDGTDITVRKNGPLRPVDVDGGDIPDIIPILSVAAACAEGTSIFSDVSRLRIKECDRLSAMADCLGRLGAAVKESRDTLTVTGAAGGTLKGGCEVSGYNDHRIVMSMAIAALSCEEPVLIRGAEAVAKSYPDFFREFRRLGGRADVVTDR